MRSAALQHIWSNYKSSLILLLGVLLGGMVGALAPAVVPYVKPVGDIFMNLLFVLIVPMVFFSVAASICNLSRRSALGRTLGITFSVMTVLMLLYAVLTYWIYGLFPCVDSDSAALFTYGDTTAAEHKPVGQLIVDAVTVTDFSDLFSVRHILPLMVVASIVGWAVSRMKDTRVEQALMSLNGVVSKTMDALMTVAPVGLACYFADLMAGTSTMMVAGLGKLLLLYLVLAVIVYAVVNPLWILFANGPKGIRQYWQAIIHPTVMAISTLSSSACMPVAMQASKNMGADPVLAESVVPLGTQIYKVGSVISCVSKVIFVLMVSGQDWTSPSVFLMAIAVSIVASMVVGAVPTGAGTAELFIISTMAADPALLGVLIVISTLVDMPGTLLNVTGNTVLPSVVGKFTKLTIDAPRAN